MSDRGACDGARIENMRDDNRADQEHTARSAELIARMVKTPREERLVRESAQYMVRIKLGKFDGLYREYANRRKRARAKALGPPLPGFERGQYQLHKPCSPKGLTWLTPFGAPEGVSLVDFPSSPLAAYRRQPDHRNHPLRILLILYEIAAGGFK